MCAGITFCAILFVLAVAAADGTRIIAYAVLIVAFMTMRYGARATRRRHAREGQSNLGDLRREAPTGDLTRLLDDLTSLGFELWVEGDDLVVEGESRIDAGLAEAIRTNKPALIALFTRPPADDMPPCGTTGY
jgi:hypothetical protein